MCALTLYTNEAACSFLRLKPDSLFYKQEEALSVLNSKNISQKYNLYKNSNVRYSIIYYQTNVLIDKLILITFQFFLKFRLSEKPTPH